MKRLILFIILSIVFSVQAQKKISEYPNTATAAGTDLFILARPSTTTNYNIRYNQLASQIITNIATNLTAGRIPVVGSNLQLSNSIALQTGTNWTLSGSLTSGPHTNATVGDYANYQSSATGTNYFGGPVGIGTIPTQQGLTVNGASTLNSIFRVGSIEFQPYALNNTWFAENAYWDTMFRYRSNGSISAFMMASGTFGFRTAPPGIGGTAATLTQRFYISDIGDVGIGGSQTVGALTGSSLTVLTGGDVGIGVIAPLASLDVNGGVNIGATAFDPGANNLSVQGNVSVTTLIRMTNSTDVAADPAATTGVQWQSTGGWEYRNSVASEGAGQINRVHNRAAQVVGVGTDYSLTQTKTNVTFGTSGGSIALPTAGTYSLDCLVNFASTTAADDLHFYLWDSTNNIVIPGSWQHHESHANNDHDVTPLTAIYTVTTNVHVWIGAVNVTAARGVVVSTNTIIKYVRCY